MFGFFFVCVCECMWKRKENENVCVHSEVKTSVASMLIFKSILNKKKFWLMIFGSYLIDVKQAEKCSGIKLFHK
jgi:hypothetical protein